MEAKIILVASLSGRTARLVARHRPTLPVYVATTDEKINRQLALSWGIESFMIAKSPDPTDLLRRSIPILKRRKILKKGDKVILVAGSPGGVIGSVNMVAIKEV